MFIGLNNAITGLTQDQLSKTINSLFSKGEQGVWYDPSDFSTMFQDAAGTTPVTAVEQPVGLILDKSGRGNHAFQATSANRPVLSARVNLLTGTETLATQTVTTRATTHTLRFEGAGTVTLSGTATGTYSAGSHSVTTTAGYLTLTVSGTVTKADLRATNMGVGLPAYQRVNTSTDYDTAGFPMYLRFDGVDDGMQTVNIDFTGTDKMTVFAGVRKLSDAAAGSIVELSATPTAADNFARFFITAASANAETYGLGMTSNGGTSGTYQIRALTYKSPITNVAAALFDSSIASGSSRVVPRVNAAAPQSIQVVFEQEGSVPVKFGSFPIFVGRRGGTTFPFNGQLYGLVIRGALSSTGEIQGAESYMNLHTGAY